MRDIAKGGREVPAAVTRAVVGQHPLDDDAEAGEEAIRPKGTMFVQMFGTAARVAAERDTFVAFVKSIR